METKRLFFRERTDELLRSVLTMPLQEQLDFFGLKSSDELNAQIKRIEVKLEKKVTNGIGWDLIQKDDQQVIGASGFHNWLKEHQRAELGYNLHPEYRGKGLMAEALQQILNYGFEKLDLNRIEAFTSPDNLTSINVLLRLGFVKEGVLRQHYNSGDHIHDSIVFSLLKTDTVNY